MKPVLQNAVTQAQALSGQLERDKWEAARSRSQVQEEKRLIDKQTQEVQYQYNLALGELNKVMPTLLEAEEALNTLVSRVIKRHRTNPTSQSCGAPSFRRGASSTP